MSRLYDVLADDGVILLERGAEEGIRALVSFPEAGLHQDPREGTTGPFRADIDGALDGLEETLGDVFDARKRRRVS